MTAELLTLGMARTISIIALIGLVASALTPLCWGHLPIPRASTRVFNIPIAVIGIVGYMAIMTLTLWADTIPLAAIGVHALIVGAAIFTIFLIVRAWRGSTMVCVLCVFVWLVNFALFLCVV